MNLKPFAALGVLWGFLVFSPAAFALPAPGLSFEFGYQPTEPTLPDSYAEAYPELHRDLKAYLDWEGTKKALITEMDERLKLVRKVKKSNERKELTKKILADKKTMIADFPERKKRLWSSILFHAEKAIRDNSSDPYLLMLIARLYYPVRDQLYTEPPEPTPEAIPGPRPVFEEPVEEKKAEEPKPDELAAYRTPLIEKAPEETAENEKAEEEEAVPAAETEKKPDYIMNLVRIRDGVAEVLEKHPEFPNHAEAVSMLAQLYSEMDQTHEKAQMWDDYARIHPDSPVIAEVLFRLALTHFESPQSFDHFTQAAIFFEKAASKYEPGTVEHCRSLYMLAWSRFLSRDFNEQAKQSFVEVYNAAKKMPDETPELEAMKKEALVQVKHIINTKEKAAKISFD